MTSLKRHFLKNFPTKFDKIFKQGVKLMSDKVLKVWWRYLTYLVIANIREGGQNLPPPAGRGLREKSQCARPNPTRPDPTQPDPTRPHHAFEKLISLERVDWFTSGLLCSMSPFNKFRIWPVPIPTGACHGTWHVPGRGCRRHPLPR